LYRLGEITRATDAWQQRSDWPPDRMPEFESYPWVTAKQLRENRDRPRRVKMLLRDFIDGEYSGDTVPADTGLVFVIQPLANHPCGELDSLYNPHYGYFPQQAVIFTPKTPFDFNAMASESEFYRQLSREYTAFEDALDKKQGQSDTRQLWHTPTELFRPHFGEALARLIVDNYRLTAQYPYDDLVIYELGAGNGTLMVNILDYIRYYAPEVYMRTRYRIIEISERLAGLQAAALSEWPETREHAEHVELIHGSIFDWDKYVPEPCWILAQEVVDNFAHDAIRYDPFTAAPMQACVLIDAEGDMYEIFIPEIDPVAKRFLQVRRTACHPPHSRSSHRPDWIERLKLSLPLSGSAPYRYPLDGPEWLRRLKYNMPFAPNLTEPEYIPTKLMEFFDILVEWFPKHRLLLSDFNYLPDTVKGYNAPVVQTRYQRRTITVSTPLVSLISGASGV
jgi:Putative S-adenosyl-L-methionine-dependent methyltransferase